jgi:predicted Zn-dependent protease
VVAADPAAPAAHLARAGALAASGDRSAAEAALEAAIARLLDEPSLYVAYAKLAAEDGRAETAAARRAAARQRLGPVPALVCAEAAELRDQGRPDAARALLTDALRAAPESFELLHDLARLAAQAGDWPCAETCWRSIMTHHAYIPWVPGELAQAITAQGRTAEADAVLAAACEAHPQDFGIAAAWARLPSAAKDWPEAQRRWARLREKFPAEGHPLWQQGIALRESGDTEAARALFLLGAEHYPADASFPHDLARMAEAERDFPAAERWWRILVGLTPQVWWAHIGLAEAIRAQDRAAEAEAVLLAAQQALPDEAALGLHHARLAVLRHDWAAAEPRFRDLAARFPHLADAPLGLAMALRALGRPDEATEILRQGLADHPDHAGFAQALGQQPEPREAASPQADFAAACAWAREASEAQDWPEARRRWASLRERFPAEGHPCWQEGIALREQGRRDEARALFLDGAALFPTDASFPHDLARLAEARGDHAEAEACWRRYVGLEPRVWWGWVGIASALRAQGQVAAAEAVLQQGSEACPETPACLEVLADWARQRRDWAEAERRAAVLADRLPDAWQGLWGQAVGLREQGRTDDAHALLLRGAERHPDITTYAHDLARLAEARADWAEAERWWRRFLALDQRPPWAHGALAHALFMQGEAAAGDAYLRDVLARHPDQLEFH